MPTLLIVVTLLEIDVYGGYAGEFGDTGIGYDVGFLQYFYPGDMKSGFCCCKYL
jgi:hypothetical protein